MKKPTEQEMVDAFIDDTERIIKAINRELPAMLQNLMIEALCRDLQRYNQQYIR